MFAGQGGGFGNGGFQAEMSPEDLFNLFFGGGGGGGGFGGPAFGGPGCECDPEVVLLTLSPDPVFFSVGMQSALPLDQEDSRPPTLADLVFGPGDIDNRLNHGKRRMPNRSRRAKSLPKRSLNSLRYFSSCCSAFSRPSPICSARQPHRLDSLSSPQRSSPTNDTPQTSTYLTTSSPKPSILTGYGKRYHQSNGVQRVQRQRKSKCSNTT